MLINLEKRIPILFDTGIVCSNCEIQFTFIYDHVHDTYAGICHGQEVTVSGPLESRSPIFISCPKPRQSAIPWQFTSIV